MEYFNVEILLQNVRPEFGGCLRKMKLNNLAFGKASARYGVKPCSQYKEEGIYFPPTGGYAILQQQLYVRKFD